MSITFTTARKIDERTTEWLPDGPELNVSNRNASLLLTELGLEFDYCGSIDPEHLLGLIGLRQMFPSGLELPTIEERGTGGARMIDCGVGPEYIPQKLRQLAHVATAAMAAGGIVQWC